MAVVASLAKIGVVDIGNVVYLILCATSFLLSAILLGNVFNKVFVAIAIMETPRTRFASGSLVHFDEQRLD